MKVVDMKQILMALFFALALGGCSWFEDNPRTSGLVVQYATMKVIEESGNPADKAMRIINVAQVALDLASNEGVLISAIEQAVRASIDFSNLSPADTLLTNHLIEIVAEELNEKVGDGGGLEGEQLVTARNVLSAVIEAAQIYL